MTSRAPVNPIVKAKAGHIRRRSSERPGPPVATAAHPMVALQRQVGNATIARTLAQREGPDEEEEIMAKHDHDAGGPSTINAMPEVGMEGGQISDGLSSRIQSQRGGGSSLDSGTRASMESAFGDTFDDVRIHTGSEADSLNRSVSAKAFTTGTDIFFSDKASPSDSNLMAHELTHVVQQRGMDSSSGPMTVGPAGDSHEQAADSAAGEVTSGGSVASAQRAEDMIAREEMPEEELV
jgi:Domain of unknown function (DUF4157)